MDGQTPPTVHPPKKTQQRLIRSSTRSFQPFKRKKKDGWLVQISHEREEALDTSVSVFIIQSVTLSPASFFYHPVMLK